MPNSMIEAKPQNRAVPSELERVASALKSMERSHSDLLKELKRDSPAYPSLISKKGVQCYADVNFFEPSAGGDLIDVTGYASKDFERRKEAAASRGLIHVVENLDAYRNRIGFSFIDVEGKGLPALHKAIQVNELMKAHNNRDFEEHGEVTSNSFEHLNDQIYGVHKGKRNVAFTYGEVTAPQKKDSEQVAICRFVNAGGLFPAVYRARTQSFDTTIQRDWTSQWPMGFARSEKVLDHKKSAEGTLLKEAYSVNQFELAENDVALFYTDGFSDPGSRGSYPISRAELVMRLRLGDHGNATTPLSELYYDLISDRVSYKTKVTDDMGLLLLRYNPKI